MSIAIVSDSACDLPKDILKKLNITEVPVNVTFGNKVYKENIDIRIYMYVRTYIKRSFFFSLS